MKESASSPERGPAINPLLIPECPDSEFLQRPTHELAQATRPAFFANKKSPVQWSKSD